jgi:seryl-tRNA synthetase
MGGDGIGRADEIDPGQMAKSIRLTEARRCVTISAHDWTGWVLGIMLDINLIRNRPDWVKAEIAKLFAEAPIDQIVALDAKRRGLLQEADELKHTRNVVSKEIGRTKDAELREAKIEEMRTVAERIKALDDKIRQVEKGLNELMLWVPNLPHASVPVGPDESRNLVRWSEGRLPEYDFDPLPHWDLGPALDIIDFERGVKMGGTRFYLLKGLGSRLQRALIQWMLDTHVRQHGYTEIYPPVMVRRDMMVGAAQLPKFEDNIYRDVDEDYWWTGTAEITLTALHREEILPADTVPLKYVAYAPCFRREKMSAGRDVRGIKRVHQFDKVEMYRLTEPDESYSALEEMVQEAAAICRGLEIPFRLVEMCTGDLGFQAAKKYDLEMWAPGCGEWLEVSSLSNCEDFQARRSEIRYRPERGAKPEYVHTLNGSGLALPRVMIAVIEQYQQADGSVVIPEVLRPYMPDVTRIEPPK